MGPRLGQQGAEAEATAETSLLGLRHSSDPHHGLNPKLSDRLTQE